MNDKRLNKKRAEKKMQKHIAKETDRDINGNLREQYSNLWFAYKFIWKINKKLLFVRIPLLLLQTLKTIIPIFFVRAVINEITIGKSLNRVVLYASVMAAASFAIKLTEYFFSVRDSIESEQLNFGIQRFLADSVEKMRYSTMEHPDMQNYIWWAQNNRFNDILTYTTGLLGALLNIIGIGSVVISLNTSVLFVIVASAIIKYIIDRYQRKLPRKYNDARSRINRVLQFYGNLMQSIRYGKEIRVNNLEDWIYEKYDSEWNANLFPLEKKYNHTVLGLQGLSGFISIIQDMVIYLILAIEVMNKIMTIGDFSMYLSAAGIFSDSVLKISSNYSNLLLRSAEFLKEYRQCVNIVKEEAMNDGNKHIDYSDNVQIRFENVSFKYPETDRMILKNINITVKRGETLSIVGANGAGKTTFVKLLCRFYEPTSGVIFINEIPAKDIPLVEYYKLLGVVFQDFKLFSFSVKENIAMDTEVDERRLSDSIVKSGLEERIKTLPNGTDTYINKEFDPNGIELSGGEGQKVAIARAVYRNAPIIVFDEPTSSLDPIAEYNIYRNFHDLAEKHTAIYISHRLSSTRFTDRIALFDNNTITEYGTHDELMQLENGIYRKMFATQAQYYY